MVRYILTADTSKYSNNLLATRPGVEPTTSRLQVQRPNCYSTKRPTELIKLH